MKACRKETSRRRAQLARDIVRDICKDRGTAKSPQEFANQMAAATLRKYVQPGRPVGSGSLGARRRAEEARKAEAGQ